MGKNFQDRLAEHGREYLDKHMADVTHKLEKELFAFNLVFDTPTKHQYHEGYLRLMMGAVFSKPLGNYLYLREKLKECGIGVGDYDDRIAEASKNLPYLPLPPQDLWEYLAKRESNNR